MNLATEGSRASAAMVLTYFTLNTLLLTCRDHFVYAPSQWEMALQSNVIFHWLGAYTKWPLIGFVQKGKTNLAWHYDQLEARAFSSNIQTNSEPVNSLVPDGAIWNVVNIGLGNGFLADGTSHYLNQCWLLHLTGKTFQKIFMISITKCVWKLQFKTKNHNHVSQGSLS